MADIVLYDRTGSPVTYEGVETITTDTPEDGVLATFTHGVVPEAVPEIEPDFSDGNQTYNAGDGKLLKEVVLKKPKTLLPENITKGTVIAGVEGKAVGKSVSKTVAPDFSEGDMTVIPDAETLLSEVIIQKPGGLVPENIAKDEVVAGIKGTAGVIDIGDENINFFAYNIDFENKTILLHYILYDKIFEKTGSYDVTIPEKIGGYTVLICCL